MNKEKVVKLLKELKKMHATCYNFNYEVSLGVGVTDETRDIYPILEEGIKYNFPASIELDVETLKHKDGFKENVVNRYLIYLEEYGEDTLVLVEGYNSSLHDMRIRVINVSGRIIKWNDLYTDIKIAIQRDIEKRLKEGLVVADLEIEKASKRLLEITAIKDFVETL